MTRPVRLGLLVSVCVAAVFAGGAVRRIEDTCGPFTDVSPLYCPYVLEAFYTGITAGTSATTFSPDIPITRGQAAVFTTKSLNQALSRGSRRAALGQWWTTTPHYDLGLGVTTVDPGVYLVACDGTDIWTASIGPGTVSRVRGSDGRRLETWTGALGATAAVAAMGRIFVIGLSAGPAGHDGSLYVIDPRSPAGDVTLVTDGLWDTPQGLAFDGTNLWVASAGGPSTKGGALSIVHPGASFPWSFTEIKNNIFLPTGGIIFDGQNIWFCDGNILKKLDSDGNLLQSVPLGHGGEYPVFDGTNIWVPSQEGHLVVVSAASGAVVADLSGNGLGTSFAAAFDGERILVTTSDPAGLSLWRAADLTPLGAFPVSASNAPIGACSDGINFWVSVGGTQVGRF